MQKTYFISGHRDITEQEFQKYYQRRIQRAMDDNSLFVVGDCQGVDTLAQIYLKNMKYENVTVYHISNEPMFNAGFKTVGGFISDLDRDFNMTKNSDDDIAWIRQGKERSGTAQNLQRRMWYNKRIKSGLSAEIKDILQMEANLFL